MAFLLQTAEVDKARAVGQKALQSISFRLGVCAANSVAFLLIRVELPNVLNWCWKSVYL